MGVPGPLASVGSSAAATRLMQAHAAANLKSEQALRVVLQRAYPGKSAADVGAFGMAVQVEVAGALGLPVSALQVLTLRSAKGACSLDLGLKGSAAGQEPIAAARLAAFIAKLGLRDAHPPTEEEETLLLGAEVHLLMGAGVGGVAGRLPDASPPTKPPEDFALLGQRPRLGDAVEALLAEADRLALERPRRDARLELLGMEVDKKRFVRQLEDRRHAQLQRRRTKAAIIIQKAFRIQKARMVVRIAWKSHKAARIQEWWRERRPRLRRWRARRRRRSAVGIQAWWRGTCCRRLLAIRSRNIAFLCLLVRMKARCAAAIRAYRGRRRRAVRIQAAWRARRAVGSVVSALRAAKVLQAAWRGAVETAKLLREWDASAFIGAWWRRRSRRLATHGRFLEVIRMARAGWKIKRFLRGRVLRRRFLEVANDRLAQFTSAQARGKARDEAQSAAMAEKWSEYEREQQLLEERNAAFVQKREAEKNRTASVLLAGAPVMQTLTAFDASSASPQVVLSQGGLRIDHQDPTGQKLLGVVFGNAPIPRFGESADAYFEVILEAVRPGEQEDSLVLGVAPARFDPAGGFYEVADSVDGWSVGYYGGFKPRGSDDFVDLQWSPSSLRVGDHVGLLVTSAGQASVFVNGKAVVSNLAGWQPGTGELFAFVDLLGDAMAVTLVRDAKPPGYTGPARSGSILWAGGPGSPGHAPALNFDPRSVNPQAASAANVLGSFNASSLGDQVKLSNNGLRIDHQDATGSKLYGVAFGDKPVQRFGGDAYFEVILEKVRAGTFDDGLTLGVTDEKPDFSKGAFEVADAVDGWSIGFDGGWKHPDDNDITDIDWKPNVLKQGDRVGLKVSSSGSASVYVNGKVAVSNIPEWPAGGELYAYVDLLGSAQAVSLVPAAAPPGFQAAAAGAGAGAAAAAGAGAGAPAKAAAPAAAQAKGAMFAFDRDLLAPNVETSADFLSAWQSSDCGVDELSVLMGESPVPSFPDGRYFEVIIESTRNVRDEGLIIGVSLDGPEHYDDSGLPEMPFDMDMVFTAGYDGVSVATGRDDIKMEWHPGDLEKGDHVGFLVTPEGEIVVFQNGEEKEALPIDSRLAGNVELFAVVALLGRVSGVRLVPGAAPPPEDGGGGGGGGASPAAPAAAAGGADDPMCWLRPTANKCIQVTDEGLVATHTERRPDAALNGVVFGDEPVPTFEIGQYFEVEIDAVRTGAQDGLVIGITLEEPYPEDVFEGGDAVPEAWSIGYDGIAFCPNGDKEPIMEETGWNPVGLKVGDRVGLLVDQDGIVSAVVNGKIVASAPGEVPENKPMWPFVDLMGSALSVFRVPDAAPPPGI